MYEKEIIPFWRGRSIRDRMMDELPEEWKDAYEAGVFTEFMEQRAPGHTVLDDKIYRKGMLDFIADIDAAIARLDFLDRSRGPRQARGTAGDARSPPKP